MKNVVTGDEVICWFDKGGCQHCKHCGYSPYDDPYCTNEKVAPKNKWPLGRDINSALISCKDHEYWEKR